MMLEPTVQSIRVSSAVQVAPTQQPSTDSARKASASQKAHTFSQAERFGLALGVGAAAPTLLLAKMGAMTMVNRTMLKPAAALIKGKVTVGAAAKMSGHAFVHGMKRAPKILGQGFAFGAANGLIGYGVAKLTNNQAAGTWASGIACAGYGISQSLSKSKSVGQAVVFALGYGLLGAASGHVGSLFAAKNTF
jgi:hypothetical protein